MIRANRARDMRKGRGPAPSFFVLRPGALALLAALLVPLFGASPLTAATYDPESLDPETGDQFLQIAPPKSAPMREILGLIEAGRPDAAIARLRAEIAEGRDGPVVQELLGLAHAKLGEIEKSLAAFGAALALDPESPSAHTNMALVLKAIGRIGEAEAHFRKALALDPEDRRAHQNLGLIAESRGDVAAAISHFEAGLRGTPPGYLGVKLDLARLYLAQNRPEDALALLGHWEGDPRAPESVALLLARGHFALNAPEKARALLAPRLENAKSPAPFIELARMAMAGRDFESAEALLARADAAFPGDAQIAFERGNLKGAMRRYEEALAFYKKGLAASPGNPALLHAAAIASQRLGRHGDALAYARKANAANPRNAGTLLLIATLHERRGQTQDAIDAYEKALLLAPESWLVRNNLAALLTPRDPARAVALARAADAASGGKEEVRDTLGWALFQAGQTEEARAIFESLTKKNPENAKAFFRLGMILKAAGDETGARKALQRSLALAPEAPFAPQAEKALADQ